MRRRIGLGSQYFIGSDFIRKGWSFCLLGFAAVIFSFLTCGLNPVFAQDGLTIYSVEVLEDKSNSDYTIYDYQEGSLTEKYYKLSLDFDYMDSKYSYVTWDRAGDSVGVTLINHEETFGYSSESKGSRTTNVEADIKSLLFDTLSSDDNGGAILNENSTSFSISSVFISNSATQNGGAIYNSGGLSKMERLST